MGASSKQEAQPLNQNCMYHLKSFIFINQLRELTESSAAEVNQLFLYETRDRNLSGEALGRGQNTSYIELARDSNRWIMKGGKPV